MAKEKMETIIRDFSEAFVKGDIEKALSFFAEDATYVTPWGTFKGKDEIRRFLTWNAQTVTDFTVTDSGIGIMVQENKAVYEHILGATMEGVRGEVLGMCAYEFSDEKIQHLRTVLDRLSLAKQVAKGWLAKRIVSSIVKRAEKGLR